MHLEGQDAPCHAVPSVPKDADAPAEGLPPAAKAHFLVRLLAAKGDDVEKIVSTDVGGARGMVFEARRIA